MAQWNYAATGPGKPAFVCSDGTDIYFGLDTGASYEYACTDIIQYDVAGNSFSTLLDMSNITDLVSIQGMVYFNGKLIVATWYIHSGTSQSLKIEEITGVDTLSTLHTVYDHEANISFIHYQRLANNDNYISYSAVLDSTQGYSSISLYSTNGTSWNAGTIPAALFDPGLFPDFWQTVYNGSEDPIDRYCTGISGSQFQLLRFESYSWTNLQTNPSDYPITTDPETGKYIAYNSIYNRDWTVSYNWTAQNSYYGPIYQNINFPYQLAIYQTGGSQDYFIYRWDDTGESYSLFDTVELYLGSPYTIFNTSSAIVRLNDGNCFLYAEESGGNWLMFERSEAIPIVSNAKFYHGLGTLEYKTDLPFTRTVPNAMALRGSLDTIVIGANDNNADPVVYLQNTYNTYSVNDGEIPTDTSISAIRWV